MASFIQPQPLSPRSVAYPPAHHRLSPRSHPSRNSCFAIMSGKGSKASELHRLQAELQRLKAALVQQQQQKLQKQQAAEQSPPQAPPSQSSSTSTSSTTTTHAPPHSVLARLGKHSQGSRFCSVSTIDSKDYSPRLVAVAGRIPALTADAFRNTPSFATEDSHLGHHHHQEPGTIAWTTIPPGFAGEVVPVPGSEASATANDLVGLRVPLHHLGLTVPSANDALVVVDRHDSSREDFDNIKFYAWSIGGQVHIGWFKDLPSEQEAQCLGRVVAAYIEEDKSTRKEKSCWLEADEVF